MPRRSLRKLAQYFPNVLTVGEVINRINADMMVDPKDKTSLVSQINSTGLTVNQPASRIPYLAGGFIAGKTLSKYLGARPFWDGVYTLGGMLYGNKMYNQQKAQGQNDAF